MDIGKTECSGQVVNIAVLYLGEPEIRLSA